MPSASATRRRLPPLLPPAPECHSRMVRCTEVTGPIRLAGKGDQVADVSPVTDLAVRQARSFEFRKDDRKVFWTYRYAAAKSSLKMSSASSADAPFGGIPLNPTNIKM